jgi:exodeoxyribonuclease VII large subunit
LDALRERLQRLQPRADNAISRQLQRDGLRLRALARSMEAVSPLATVARGYAILTREDDGSLVRSPLQVRPGDTLKARVQDGVIDVTVNEPAR